MAKQETDSGLNTTVVISSLCNGVWRWTAQGRMMTSQPSRLALSAFLLLHRHTSSRSDPCLVHDSQIGGEKEIWWKKQGYNAPSLKWVFLQVPPKTFACIWRQRCCCPLTVTSLDEEWPTTFRWGHNSVEQRLSFLLQISSQWKGDGWSSLASRKYLSVWLLLAEMQKWWLELRGHFGPWRKSHILRIWNEIEGA